MTDEKKHPLDDAIRVFGKQEGYGESYAQALGVLRAARNGFDDPADAIAWLAKACQFEGGNQ